MPPPTDLCNTSEQHIWIISLLEKIIVIITIRALDKNDVLTLIPDLRMYAPDKYRMQNQTGLAPPLLKIFVSHHGKKLGTMLNIMSCVELLFPPTATLPQIKFSFSYILSILACCFLRHVFICPLDHSFSFPYSLFVTK